MHSGSTDTMEKKMKQATFASVAFDAKKKRTRRI